MYEIFLADTSIRGDPEKNAYKLFQITTLVQPFMINQNRVFDWEKKIKLQFIFIVSSLELIWYLSEILERLYVLYSRHTFYIVTYIVWTILL